MNTEWGTGATGATGYIGGDALSVLSQAHPEFEFSLLVRTQEKAQNVKAQYPNATIVLGDLDDSGLLREQAAKADIVLREYSTSFRSLFTHSPSSPPPPPLFLLLLRSTATSTRSCWRPRRTSSRPPSSARPPSTGPAAGPSPRGGARSTSSLDSSSARVTRPSSAGGRARWNHVHVADLSEAFRLLVEQAVASSIGEEGNKRQDDKEMWGAWGYYFVESGEHVWGELARGMAGTAFEMGLLGGTTTKPEEAGAARIALLHN
ncbi:hypothetical protein PG994_012223 [Apiospora phragmitis]|uniref:NAD(P)-binding domain-containing protein n=1 Tax=Apiospora phragmitis TaxID=2905665 RepID=A0ABR1TXN0_9PEZI